MKEMSVYSSSTLNSSARNGRFSVVINMNAIKLFRKEIDEYWIMYH